MKGLINIVNKDKNCFLWYHIRHFNLLKLYPERITKAAGKKIVNNLDHTDINIYVSKKDC